MMDGGLRSPHAEGRMIARALALLVILPSFVWGMLFAAGAFAPARPHDCGTPEMAAFALWVMAAVASVFAPGLLSVGRAVVGKSTDDLRRLAGIALLGHVVLFALSSARYLLLG